MAIRFKEPRVNPAEQEYLAAQSAAALAGAMPSRDAFNAANPMKAFSGFDFGAANARALQAQDEQMAADAQRARDLARFKELESRRQKRMKNPNLRMAAMLAMAGQPGALQSMIMAEEMGGSAKGASNAQAEMDALEEKMANDMFALSTASPSNRRQMSSMLSTIYESNFKELENKGANSRFGGWDAWLDQFGQEQKRYKAAVKRAQERKAAEETSYKNAIDER